VHIECSPISIYALRRNHGEIRAAGRQQNLALRRGLVEKSTAINPSFLIRLLRQALSGQMRVFEESDDTDELMEQEWYMHDDGGRLCSSVLDLLQALGRRDP
jgi:hypothetical protein